MSLCIYYTANVLPMETTDFVCVQNPVLVYLYFLTMKGLRATESHLADPAPQPKQQAIQRAELEK